MITRTVFSCSALFIISMFDANHRLQDVCIDDVELGDSYHIDLVRVPYLGPMRHELHCRVLDFTIFTIQGIDSNEEGLRTGIVWKGIPDFYMNLNQSKVWRIGESLFYEAPTMKTNALGRPSLTPGMFAEIRGKVDTSCG